MSAAKCVNMPVCVRAQHIATCAFCPVCAVKGACDFLMHRPHVKFGALMFLPCFHPVFAISHKTRQPRPNTELLPHTTPLLSCRHLHFGARAISVLGFSFPLPTFLSVDVPLTKSTRCMCSRVFLSAWGPGGGGVGTFCTTKVPQRRPKTTFFFGGKASMLHNNHSHVCKCEGTPTTSPLGKPLHFHFCSLIVCLR